MRKTLGHVQAGRVRVVVSDGILGRQMLVVEDNETLQTGRIVATSRAGALALAGAVLELADLMAQTEGKA